MQKNLQVVSNILLSYIQSGIVLCHLMNKINPGSIKKINESGSNFKMADNISA